MVDKIPTSRRNVVDFQSYQQRRQVSARALVASALAITARNCRHCGAGLAEGESENDCSSALNVAHPTPVRFRATPER
jgi:hypothetical protein